MTMSTQFKINIPHGQAKNKPRTNEYIHHPIWLKSPCDKKVGDLNASHTPHTNPHTKYNPKETVYKPV